MPYIKTTFTEGGFLTDLKDLLVTNGWTQETSFRKVAYNLSEIFYSSLSGSTPNEKRPLTIWLADHIIVKNASGDMFGIARITKSERFWGNLPAKYKVVAGTPDITKLETDELLREELHAWMATQYEENAVDTSELYFYMLNTKPTVPTGKTAVYPVASAQGAVDVEILSYTPIKNTGSASAGYSFEKAEFDLLRMQSPMMKIKTRDTGTATNGWLTNWWSDSKIRVEGLVSNKTVSIIIQADNTAAYDDNNVPTIPLYMGQIVPLNAEDGNESVLFGGMAVSDSKFDYTDTKPLVTTPLLPVEKKYPKNPGNGIDNLIVKRSKYGAYYQAYYLSFLTAPDTMPPDRSSTDGKQYVSSWKNERNDEYGFKFSPSSYDKKTHVSRAYVVHPEEGHRGYLKDMIMTSSMGHLNGDTLKLKVAACPNVFQHFKYFVVDAVSPMTKRPATAFSPAGFGIFEKEA